MGNFFQKIVEVQFGTEVADATQILMVVSEEIEQVNQARATAANAQQVQRETDRLIRLRIKIQTFTMRSISHQNLDFLIQNYLKT